MADSPFVPTGFTAPTSLTADRFRLEPLGPEHNAPDLAAWTSSIEHIRATPGYPDGDWPPLAGMSPERNLSDLTRHAADFAAGKGFTFTVIEPGAPEGSAVIGCVYLYPPEREGYDVIVQSWVRADRAELDQPLADAVARWLETDWPWERPRPLRAVTPARRGRSVGAFRRPCPTGQSSRPEAHLGDRTTASPSGPE